MKFNRLHVFLLGCCMPIHMAYPLQSTARLHEGQWVDDTVILYNIIDVYNKNNGSLSAAKKQEFKKTLNRLEREINALDPKKYDVEKYKKEYVNSYEAWEPYILEASDEKESQDSTAKEIDTEAKSQTDIQKTTQQEDGAQSIAKNDIAQDEEKIAEVNAFDKNQEIAARKESMDVSKNAFDKNSNEDNWIANALSMCEILDAYRKNGYVSVDEQEKYFDLLNKIEKEIDALSSKKYAAKDIATYRAIYLDPYKKWKDFIFEEVADIQQPSEQELQIEANAKKSQQILKDVEQKIAMYGDEFVAAVEALLEGLGEYSKANQDALFKDFSNEVITFKSYMKTVKNNAINSYFSYMKNSGQKVDALHLTPEQHKLVFGVTKMTQQAIMHIEAVVLALTTNTSAATFANQAADAFIQYEKETDAGYQKVLEANRQLGNKSGWDALKSFGSRVIKSFGLKMQEAAKKQAEEQIQKVLEEKGAELAEAIGKKAGEIGGAALEKIKGKAGEIGGKAFEALKDRANALGGSALKVLTEKGKDLGNDLVNKARDKIVEEVKKQVSNQTGVDVDALVELLSQKGVSPEALRKVLVSRFPVSSSQKDVAVQVQENSHLCAQEKSYIKNRLALVEKTLREDFNIDKPLRLAFSCSGGGNRAMIGTLGLFIGAARHKFLDASMYLTGLSGSTWTIAPWSYMYLKGLLTDESQDSKNNPIEYSLQEFKAMLMKALDYSCPLASCPGDIFPPEMLSSDIQMSFSNNLAKRFAYDQPITMIDSWGAFVSNYALRKVGSDRLNVTWSSIAQDAEKGLIPLPICSSVFDFENNIPDRSGYRAEYKWFETGPFEAGSKSLGFIPVWALGSVFKDGKIVIHTPEYEMSEFLGMYGSAFAISINDLIDKGTPVPLPSFNVLGVDIKLPVDTWIRKLIDGVNKDIRANRSRFVRAQFANYSKGLASSILKDKDQLAMFDGGINFNIPLPLLFDRTERGVDVVIMYDSNPGDLQCLIDASRYFAKNGTAVPNMQIDPVTGGSVTQEGLLSRPMTVFNDPRKSATYKAQLPTLIYLPTPQTNISQAPYNLDLAQYPGVKMPIDSSKSPYITTNFKYTSTEFENLSQTIEAIFESQVDEIKLIMKLVSEKKAVVKNVHAGITDKKEGAIALIGYPSAVEKDTVFAKNLNVKDTAAINENRLKLMGQKAVENID